MSYDLHVYGRDIELPELRDVITAADLAVEKDDAGSLIVVRGKRRRYSFTVSAPVLVDPEDIPDEVVAAVLAPTHMVEVLVEGSAASEIPHAIRAARRIATAIEGAALDQQAGDVFHRGRSRLAPRAEPGLVSVVDVHWYLRVGEMAPERVARTFVDAARRHIPEALPRRYGSYEPLKKRWDDGADEAFVAFVAAETDSVYMRGTSPVQHASIGRARDPHAVVSACSLTMFAAPLEDERWQRSLEGVFVEFAKAVDAVYASGEVVRGIEWSGRSLWYGADAEHATYLAGRGEWSGLPPYPVWLSWARVRALGSRPPHWGHPACQRPSTPTVSPARRPRRASCRPRDTGAHLAPQTPQLVQPAPAGTYGGSAVVASQGIPCSPSRSRVTRRGAACPGANNSRVPHEIALLDRRARARKRPSKNPRQRDDALSRAESRDRLSPAPETRT